MDRVAAVGEPWLSFFTADEIRDRMLSFGHRSIEDRSATQLLADYGVRTRGGHGLGTAHHPREHGVSGGRLAVMSR
ncbi:hypothetical protein [Nocardia sp. NPDC005366]|uniref:hypothetical protein n=1 Tax=Nocardia sp. NPDC005366 TaxID=3156878 RepID=UPI0033ACB85E